MADKKQRIKRFLRDLTSIEINTIVTERILPMGDLRQEVERLRSAYASKLGSIAKTHQGGSQPAADSTLESAAAETARAAADPESMSFGEQERRADALLRHEARLSPDDQHQLARIRGYSGELERLSRQLGAAPAPAADALESVTSGGAAPGAAAQPPELGPEDTIALRKILELGTESIAVQTVIQASGDMITRIHPDYATGEQPLLLELHRGGVATVSEMWRSLIDAAVSLLDKIIDR